jgi:hypothetical protein
MQRKNWLIEEGTSCVLCDGNVLEDRDHLFFLCPFAQSCWERTHITWNQDLPIWDKVVQARNSFRGPCFMEIFVSAAWNIWKERNDFIFKLQQPSRRRWKVRFQNDLLLHQYRVKDSVVQPLIDWILHFSS